MIDQLGDDIVDFHGHTLLDKAFLTNRPKVIEFLLTVAKDPQELLAHLNWQIRHQIFSNILWNLRMMLRPGFFLELLSWAPNVPQAIRHH